MSNKNSPSSKTGSGQNKLSNLNKTIGVNKYTQHDRQRKHKNRQISKIALIICIGLISITLIMTLAEKAQASLFESSSDSLIDLAREKKYKGARDEEELKVLPTVQNSEYGRKRPPESNEGF